MTSGGQLYRLPIAWEKPRFGIEHDVFVHPVTPGETDGSLGDAVGTPWAGQAGIGDGYLGRAVAQCALGHLPRNLFTGEVVALDGLGLDTQQPLFGFGRVDDVAGLDAAPTARDFRQ